MRIPDDQLPGVVPARARARGAGRRADGGEARARARDRRALARGGGRSEGGGALHPGRAGRPGARRACPKFRFPRAIRCICRRSLASAFGLSTSEARRLIGQDGVKVDGVAVTELDVPRAALVDKTAAGRQAPLRQTALNRLTERSWFATVLRPPERLGGSKSLSRDRTGASPGLDRIRSAPQALEASGASRRLFYAATSKVALVFENSTACVYVETSSSRRLRPSRPSRECGEASTKTTSTLRYFGSGAGDTLSSSSKRKIARSRSLTALWANNPSRRV